MPMHVNVPAALLPGLAALPGALGAAPRPDGRAFSDLLRQKQAAPPAPARPAAPRPAAAPTPAAAQPPAKEPERPAERPAGAADEAAAEAAPAARSAPAATTGDGDAAGATPGAAGASDDAGLPDDAAQPEAATLAEAGTATRRGKGPRLGDEAAAKAAAGFKAGALARPDPLPAEAAIDGREPGERATIEAADPNAPAGLDPALAQFVAELHLGGRSDPAAGGATAAAGELRGHAAPEGSTAARLSSGDAAVDARAEEALRADADAALAQAATAMAADRMPEQRLHEGSGALSAARGAEAIGTRHDTTARDALPLPAGFLAGAAGTPAGASPAPGSAAAAASPHGVPDFAHTLGAQISVLAREGVQRARLNLHGGEMGAVSVQIVMDGTQARVDFGADAAATRDAIEAGLPDLASALREAGLTLSGGDVSPRHSRPGSGGPGGEAPGRGASAARAAAGPTAEAGHAVPLRRFGSAAGGVDLYA